MNKDEAIAHYEAALKEAFPRGATGDVFHHWNEARKAMAQNARELGLDYDTQSDHCLMENAQGDLERVTLVQPGVGIGKRAEEAYASAKGRGWVGVFDDIAQSNDQKPVAYSYTSRITGAQGFSHHPMPRFIDADSWDIKPLYTSPPQRTWVGLTDEMVVAAARMLSDRQAAACNVDCGDMWKMHGNDFIEDARAALEAAHGIKVDAK